MAHVAPPREPNSCQNNRVCWIFPCPGGSVIFCKQCKHICNQISDRNYASIQGGVWDYTDSEVDTEDFDSIGGLVKINRFPGSFSICKKDELVTNYKWLQRRAKG